MDDPTSYLTRDSNDVAIMLAPSIAEAQFQAKQYGCAIQVNMAGGIGIRCVVSPADADVVLSYPADTPWCMAHDSTANREAALRSGCVAYLTKPFSAWALAENLRASAVLA